MTQFDLRCEDCIKGMSRLTNESVDLVVTSPPYNLGIGYSQYSDRRDRQSYLNWCARWAAQVRRILRSNGSFFLNVGSAPSNPMLPHQIVIELTSASGGFLLQNTIHWIKSIAVEDKEGDLKSHGHFKPITSKRFLNDCHECIFHFTKPGVWSSTASQSAFRTRTRATSRAGRTLAEAIYDVGATPGSFPTRQFRAAKKNGHIPRRFLFS